jgi:hypothetical protein
MTEIKKITSFAYSKLHLPEYHNWLDNYVNHILTAERAATLHMTTERAQLMEINNAISDASTERAAYPETSQIEFDIKEIIAEAQKLLAALDYFADDYTATDAEKAAAQLLRTFTDSFLGLGEKTINQCVDAARDVSRELLKHQSELTAVRQLVRVQHIQTLHNNVVSLINARDARRLIRSGVNSGSDIRPSAEPIRQQNYEDLASISRRGTDEERAIVNEMIDEINAFHLNLGQMMKQRDTLHAKGEGGKTPGHKPHDPNKPSDNEDRPEGVPPNEEGDEPDNSGDSGNGGNSSDNTENTSGGNSGNGNNENPPSGGNNGGSDKPPNPESPD